MIDEQGLLLRVRQVDTTALGLVYDYFSLPIYRYAYHMLGDTDLAEDCLADTFKRFLQVIEVGKGPHSHLQAYLYRIAHNWITDHYRNRNFQEVELHEDLVDGKLDPTMEVHLRLEREHIREAVKQLTLEQQRVIFLKYIEEYDNKEVARIMNKSVGSVKALQHRALSALRQYLVEDVS
ncbi:MAG: sigma-70 family RNA polymerase sigma factor [Anaerolineaceae bacterium]|nr:sigma-70 family RNA polymerase sigma factor [Anaerolineaceae bacterium]MBN2677761.1 sigma-70 family RNA polymerase sigma factor [Anaerolineaceae bacterium]